MSAFSRTAKVFNAAVVPLLGVPVVGRTLGKGMVVLAYTGRRSGTRVELPVSYRRRGDQVQVGVAMPDQKTWWRNFTGDGGPVEVHLQEGTRTGHAVARRDEKGAVTVAITLGAQR
ncbi:nitroreductase/quinone reductase family protein [Rhodococcus sp. HNM0569]|uniref:nitroreductase/quinone reductase family protein n=1 Tax=Rhodococcus sp. HNM0569 TaxID=2716340 RepID=UPI001469B2BC|nr:nitroreductase/quinone reductase family protein [Rhodococcus sp. HNM0569]NLU81242.1 nitroreductase family deazaflavin-dependent oxidoreductase [Rhodococcus sp. HNM0569]